MHSTPRRIVDRAPTTRFMFDIPWNVQIRPVHRTEQPMGCQTPWNYDIHVWYSMKRPDTSSTSHGATYGMPNTVELRDSCLIFHETSSTSHGATYGMPNTVELRHSCLIFHETSRYVQYIARSNLWHAKHRGTTTFMFDIPWNVQIRPVHRTEQPMGCQTQWNYDIHVWYSIKRPVHRTEQPMGCQTQWNYEFHVWYSMKRPVDRTEQPMGCQTQWNFQYIARSNLWDAKRSGTTRFTFDIPWNVQIRPVHRTEQPMGCQTQWNYDIHVWYSMKRPDTSSTSHGATYGMPNTVELRHSCLIFHETSRHVQYIALSNLWDAKHSGTTTFMFDIPWNVQIRPVHRTEQPMACQTQWNYDIHVWYSMKRPVHRTEQPMGCQTQWNYDIHVWYSMKRPVHRTEQPMGCQTQWCLIVYWFWPAQLGYDYGT